MRIFKIDMLRILSSIKFWIAVLSVVIIGVLSAYMMNQMLGVTKNGFWIFIDAVLLDGFLAAVSPAIVVLPFSTSLFNDINSKNSNNILTRISARKYFRQRFFSVGVSGALVMLLGTLILLGIFLLYDSSTEFIDENFVPKFLPNLFNKSLFLYCLSSIFVFTIFGFNFSVFGMSSALILRNKYLGMAFPIVYYHCAPIIVWIIGNSFPFLFYIFPVDVLNIVSHDINYLVSVYFLIFIVGTGLTYKAYKKCINGEW